MYVSEECPSGYAPAELCGKDQIGLNIFQKWNVSDDNVTSHQTYLLYPLPTLNMHWFTGVHSGSQLLPYSDAWCWKSLSTTPQTSDVAGRFTGSAARKFREL